MPILGGKNNSDINSLYLLINTFFRNDLSNAVIKHKMLIILVRDAGHFKINNKLSKITINCLKLHQCTETVNITVNVMIMI